MNVAPDSVMRCASLAVPFRRAHDALLANGSLPLSVVEWLLLDDRSSLDAAEQ